MSFLQHIFDSYISLYPKIRGRFSVVPRTQWMQLGLSPHFVVLSPFFIKSFFSEAKPFCMLLTFFSAALFSPSNITFHWLSLRRHSSCSRICIGLNGVLNNDPACSRTRWPPIWLALLHLYLFLRLFFLSVLRVPFDRKKYFVYLSSYFIFSSSALHLPSVSKFCERK